MAAAATTSVDPNALSFLNTVTPAGADGARAVPTWMDVYNNVYAPAYAQSFSGGVINRPWNTDPQTMAAKATLDQQYQDVLGTYNTMYGTSYAPDASVLGPNAQPNQFVWSSNRGTGGGFFGSDFGKIAALAALAAGGMYGAGLFAPEATAAAGTAAGSTAGYGMSVMAPEGFINPLTGAMTGGMSVPAETLLGSPLYTGSAAAGSLGLLANGATAAGAAAGPNYTSDLWDTVTPETQAMSQTLPKSFAQSMVDMGLPADLFTSMYSPLSYMSSLANAGSSVGQSSGGGGSSPWSWVSPVMSIASGLLGYDQYQKQRDLLQQMMNKGNPWQASGGQGMAIENLKQFMADPSAAMAADPSYKLRMESALRKGAIYGPNSGGLAKGVADASTAWYDQRLQTLANLAGVNQNGTPGAGAITQLSGLSSDNLSRALASIGFGVNTATGGNTNPLIQMALLQQAMGRPA